jgi:hypothetical protein
MTGHASEQAMSIREVAQWIAIHTGAPAPNSSTVNRWVVHGVRGVHLQAKRVGAKFWTTPTDVARFLDQLNDSTGKQHPVGSADAQTAFQQAVRKKQIDAACEKLESICSGFNTQNSSSANEQKMRGTATRSKTSQRVSPPRETTKLGAD